MKAKLVLSTEHCIVLYKSFFCGKFKNKNVSFSYKNFGDKTQ